MGLHGAYAQLDPLEPRATPTPKRPHGAALLAVLSTLFLLTLLLLLHLRPRGAADVPCGDTCRIVLVESIPEGMAAAAAGTATSEAWLGLLAGARRSVDIASFYWTLTNADTGTREPSAAQVGHWDWCQTQREWCQTQLDDTKPNELDPNPMSLTQTQLDGAKPTGWHSAQGRGHHPTPAPGLPHALPIGAAPRPARATSRRRRSPQVKELGAAIYNCSCLAQDLGKIFEAYWALGVPGASIPAPWPESFSTSINLQTPLEVTLNDTAAAVFFSSSPAPLCAAGRTPDLEALLAVIDGAEAFVDVAVMSYVPGTEFSRPRRFWPAIDERLRRAAVERGLRLRLLAGCWPHSHPAMFPFLRSLAALADNRTGYRVQVRLFLVPASAAQSRIPFARVSHLPWIPKTLS
ncbi:5'-3' exonuclease PLD3-like [Passer montanus]|uniref:5'-3' exonuclease PLD3-like n=1 Tax=Passer montanus TaxID=9160 RepID=UPI001960192B|nr:5'-3' exonuclease PLD3-like [Passer montanus]